MEGWTKLEELGSGSFGSVFLVTDSSKSMKAAVKTAQFDTPSSVIIREGKFLCQLIGTPNVVRCFGDDISIANNQAVYSLLLEYAEGGSLRNLIENTFDAGKIIPETHVAYYASLLLEGLAQIHSLGIVHCDLKPANILVFPVSDGYNQLKIGDFGSARRISEKEVEIRVSDDETETHSKTTLPYASPESVASGLHGTCTDIWSLGCVVAEMITGEPIWDSYDDMGLIDEILHGSVSDRIPKKLSDDGVDFLKKCLMRNPEDRWSAEELLDHPFIVENLEIMSKIHFHRPEERQKSCSQINPFGMSDWVSKKHLFTPKWLIEAMEKENDEQLPTKFEASEKDDEELPTKSKPGGFRKCISFIVGRIKKCKSTLSCR